MARGSSKGEQAGREIRKTSTVKRGGKQPTLICQTTQTQLHWKSYSLSDPVRFHLIFPSWSLQEPHTKRQQGPRLVTNVYKCYRAFFAVLARSEYKISCKGFPCKNVRTDQNVVDTAARLECKVSLQNILARQMSRAIKMAPKFLKYQYASICNIYPYNLSSRIATTCRCNISWASPQNPRCIYKIYRKLGV